MSIRASHLIFCFKIWEKREEIISKIEKGINIIIDKYAFSCVAYTGANVKNKYI
jgi:dTMP kinase